MTSWALTVAPLDCTPRRESRSTPTPPTTTSPGIPPPVRDLATNVTAYPHSWQPQSLEGGTPMLQRGSKTRMLLTSLALAWALAIIAAAGNASAGKSSSPLGMAAVAFVVIIALRLAYRRIARPRGGR